MNITIRKLSAKSENNLENYMEHHAVKSKSGAIDEILAAHSKIPSLEMQRNQLKNDLDHLTIKYDSLIRALQTVQSFVSPQKENSTHNTRSNG